MGRVALPNEKGLTLVEVIIAVVIMLLVSLALMQTALLSIESNFRNVIRDEAVNIAEMRMNEARNIPFESLASDPMPGDDLVLTECQNPPVNDLSSYPRRINRDLRNVTAFDFGTRRTIATMGPDNRQITVLVRWVYKNECYTHSVSTIVRRQ